MTIYGAESVSAAYELRVAAGKAANLARKVLPPVIGEIVFREMEWMKDSTWAANHDRLKLAIAEVNALAEARERAA